MVGNEQDIFARVKNAACPRMETVIRRLLPGGKRIGAEYVVRNPRRADNRPGSFKINIHTGRWADFATGDKGGDVISLAAYLFGLRQIEAAHRLADMLGVNHG